MSLESELLTLLPDASQYDRDDLVHLLVLYIKDLVNKNTGPLKVDLHFAYLAQEKMREEHSDERVTLQDRIEELEAQLRLETESNEVRDIITSLAQGYWTDDDDECVFCERVGLEHTQDCLAMRAKKLLRKT